MTLGQVSVLVPRAPIRIQELLPYAELVQRSQAHRLWQGQTTSVDPFQTFAAAAEAGHRVPCATGVTLMPLRHPFEAALKARTLATITGHPFVAGFGPGAASFQTALLGEPYESPLQATREYLGTVRRLLDGQLVDIDGRYVRCTGRLAAAPSPAVEVGAGVLRRGMARVAGEVADSAISWLTPAPYVADTLRPALQEGAAQAGRAIPRIVAMVPVALAVDGQDPEQTILASNRHHLLGPHYVDMLARAGIDVDLHDEKRSARALADGGAFLYGGLDDVAAGVREYHDAGIDEVVLNATGVCHVRGHAEAVQELEALVTTLAE